MRLMMKVTNGPDRGREFPLAVGESLTIGRGDQADARINDPSVSRLHCEVSRSGDTITLKDTGSSSGTKVNGTPVELTQLSVGSQFVIGDSTVEIVDADVEKTRMSDDNDADANIRAIDSLAGEKINHYRLEKIIGTGTTGVVYKATDEEKNRPAAVKVLTPRHARLPQQRDRFVRAMKTMIPIRSPHIMRIYNAGITGPYCWTAMEFVDGENLSQVIDRVGIENMLDWRKVWKVAVDIGQALNTAHEKNIVHRNVTPTNIMLRTSDGAAVLGDLMLAKAIDDEHAVQITQPGQLMGEIPYLAPERTLPDGDIDIRSDIYGLGATCYALLTGKPPAEGQNLAEILESIRNGKPKQPREFQLSINDLFQDLIMQRMLAKDPGKRFQTPSELIKELLRVGTYNGLSI
ncbi:MAG: FHA domain-containing serine/threonine-protein kinase [Pirellulaceae bacterium]